MHGVAAQQRGALDDVFGGPFPAAADDDGAQPEPVAGAGLLDEQPGDEPSDAAEAVEDDVTPLTPVDLVGAGGPGDGLGRELLDRQTAVVALPGRGEHADVDLRGPEVERGERPQEGHRLGDRQLRTRDLAGEAVGLEDADHRLVHQGTAVQQDRDVLLPVQLPDHRDHRFRGLFAVLPVGERVVVDSHVSYLSS